MKILALGLLSTTCALAAPAAANADTSTAGFAFDVQRDQGRLQVTYKGRPLLVYAFAGNQFKPYVKELYTLQGDNVVVDAPPDHLHHHGLMYAIRVNGNNFWEERDQPGYEKSFSLLPPQSGRSASGLPQAWFTQVVLWVPYKDVAVADPRSVALLVESRTLTLTVDEALQEVALDWHADFKVGAGAPTVTLAGANYHGLGLRLPAAFNLVAQHQNSQNAPPTNRGGEVTPARWSSVSHRLNDHDITVAVFGHPETDGKLPMFFTMVQPFTYLSVTQGLDKATRQYSAGDKFSLDYRVVSYTEHRNPEFLQKRYSTWNDR
jgi:hypothetical protein